jgi:hypothetical protein
VRLFVNCRPPAEIPANAALHPKVFEVKNEAESLPVRLFRPGVAPACFRLPRWRH